MIVALAAPGWPTLIAMASGLGLAAIGLRVAERIPHRGGGIRAGAISWPVQWRVVWLTAGAALGVLGLTATGLVVGDFPIAAGDALATALWDHDSEYGFIVNQLRFPRVTVAVLAGMCLAASGAIFQALIDNPLVSPDIIGINNGAAVCAVFIIAAGGDVSLLPYAAFVGALGTAVAIYLLAWRRGVSGSRLVLVGIGINAILAAAITFALVRYPIERVVAAARWQAGTLFGASWDDARTLGIGLAVLLPVAVVLVRRLRILQLGDDAAASLGLRVERDRLLLIAAASGLAAVAVAVVGPLAFVALLVPHIARLIAGNLTGGVLILAAMLGGVFLLGADLIAQRLFAPTILPAGVVTGAMGGPYFLVLLARYNRAL